MFKVSVIIEEFKSYRDKPKFIKTSYEKSKRLRFSKN